jgi:hypothetical protein
MLFVNNDDLTSLYIAGTQVTDEGVAAFFAARHRRLKAAGRDDTLSIVRDEFEAEAIRSPYSTIATPLAGSAESTPESR